MGTDVYGADFRQIGGYARATDAELTFLTEGLEGEEDTYYTLAANQVTVVATEKVTPMFLPAQKVDGSPQAVIITEMPRYSVSIGALVGKGLSDFLLALSDPGNMDLQAAASPPGSVEEHDGSTDTGLYNPFVIEMTSSSITDTNLTVLNSIKWKFYGNKLVSFQTSNEGGNVLVATKLQIFSVNADLVATAEE